MKREFVAEPYAIISSDRPPVVHAHVVNEPTDTNYPAYLNALGEAFRSLDKFALIFDTGDLTRFPAKYREQQSRWMADTQDEFEGRLLGIAFVIPQPVIRGVLMAMYWIKKPYYSYSVVANEASAWAWTSAELARHGIEVPKNTTA